MTERWNYDIINRMHTCRVCKLTFANRAFIILNISIFRTSSSFFRYFFTKCMHVRFRYHCINKIYFNGRFLIYIIAAIFLEILFTLITLIISNIAFLGTGRFRWRMPDHRTIILWCMLMVASTNCSCTLSTGFAEKHRGLFKFFFGCLSYCFFGCLLCGFLSYPLSSFFLGYLLCGRAICAEITFTCYFFSASLGGANFLSCGIILFNRPFLRQRRHGCQHQSQGQHNGK